MDDHPNITDDQWRLIEPFVPTLPSPNPRRISDRAVCTALALVLLDGVSWDTAAYRCHIGTSTLRLRWVQWYAEEVFPALWRVSRMHTDEVHEWGKRFASAAAHYVQQTADRRRQAHDRIRMREIAATVIGPSGDAHRTAWKAQCEHDGTSF